MYLRNLSNNTSPRHQENKKINQLHYHYSDCLMFTHPLRMCKRIKVEKFILILSDFITSLSLEGELSLSAILYKRVRTKTAN